MSLKDLPAEMHLREKLLAPGSAALSDVELLALLLRTGLPGKGWFDLAGQVLGDFGGFAELLQAEADDLKRIKGLGPAKRAEIAAVVAARPGPAAAQRAGVRCTREGRGLCHPAPGHARAGGLRSAVS